MSWNGELQRTEDWARARAGKITASRVARIVNGTVRGWATLAAELAFETTPAYIHEEFYSKYTEHGKEYEPVAIANAQLMLGEEFEPVGFAVHPKYDFIGCSSDFLARDGTYNGEVKCPLLLEKHMLAWSQKQMPKEYYPQVQLQMAVHGVHHTLFISHYAGNKKLHPDMQTAIVEVGRDERYIEEMIKRCIEFRDYMTGQRPVTSRNNSVLPQLF